MRDPGDDWKERASDEDARDKRAGYEEDMRECVTD